jgi:hypothetical protein
MSPVLLVSAPTPVGPQPIRFQDVVTVPDATADRLYQSALRWFGLVSLNSHVGIPVRNRQTGTLAAKAEFHYRPPDQPGRNEIEGPVRYAVTIEVKDGRYRYTIDNFVHEGTRTNRRDPISFGLLTTAEKSSRSTGQLDDPMDAVWRDLQVLANAEAQNLIQSMREKIGAAPESW